ncbi:MAG TPA: hypothetical protein VKG84_13070 [Candidatus Acidoferrales bacterium]|nr:hypothetical protein [Candidatus Acidoferrales bacterium]
MLQAGQAVGFKSAPPQYKAGDSKAPHCCGQEMRLLLRRAVLHSDGSVDFKATWGCGNCGRRIL